MIQQNLELLLRIKLENLKNKKEERKHNMKSKWSKFIPRFSIDLYWFKHQVFKVKIKTKDKVGEIKTQMKLTNTNIKKKVMCKIMRKTIKWTMKLQINILSVLILNKKKCDAKQFNIHQEIILWNNQMMGKTRMMNMNKVNMIKSIFQKMEDILTDDLELEILKAEQQ